MSRVKDYLLQQQMKEWEYDLGYEEWLDAHKVQELSEADLYDTNLSEANLKMALLVDADLSGAIFSCSLVLFVLFLIAWVENVIDQSILFSGFAVHVEIPLGIVFNYLQRFSSMFHQYFI